VTDLISRDVQQISDIERPVGNDGRPLNMSEVRHVHHLAMTSVWDVAPHPDASDREGPGSTTFTRSRVE
jgi:hypothetical protein